MSTVIWEDPPERRSAADRVAHILATVRERPGVWARVDMSAATAYNIRRERGHEFEVRVINRDDHKGVYLRARSSEVTP